MTVCVIVFKVFCFRLSALILYPGHRVSCVFKLFCFRCSYSPFMSGRQKCSSVDVASVLWTASFTSSIHSFYIYIKSFRVKPTRCKGPLNSLKRGGPRKFSNIFVYVKSSARVTNGRFGLYAPQRLCVNQGSDISYNINLSSTPQSSIKAITIRLD